MSQFCFFYGHFYVTSSLFWYFFLIFHHVLLLSYSPIASLSLSLLLTISFTLDGSTPLHIAASRSNNALVMALVESGARLDVRDRKGRVASDYFPGLRELPHWLIGSFVDTFLQAQQEGDAADADADEDAAANLRKLKGVCLNEDHHAHVVEKLFAQAEARKRIVRVLKEKEGDEVEELVAIVELIFASRTSGKR